MDFVDEYYADKDLSPLKKLTLVIPTYNRNYYLSRCLWYHAHFPFGQSVESIFPALLGVFPFYVLYGVAGG